MPLRSMTPDELAEQRAEVLAALAAMQAAASEAGWPEVAAKLEVLAVEDDERWCFTIGVPPAVPLSAGEQAVLERAARCVLRGPWELLEVGDDGRLYERGRVIPLGSTPP